MPGRRLTPEQRSLAAAMRSAGYTHAAIAERIGVSIRTLSRLLAHCETKREPVSDEIVSKLRQELLEEVSGMESLRLAVATSVTDDLAITRAIRSKSLDVIEALDISSHDRAREAARALGQVTQAIKATQAVARTALRADREESFDPPTELIIREMSAEDEARVRARAARPWDEREDEE